MGKRQTAKEPKEGLEEPSFAVDEAVRRVIGAAIEVHRTIGPGSDVVYERALCVELELRGIPFERQPTVHVIYKNVDVGTGQLGGTQTGNAAHPKRKRGGNVSP